MATKTNKTLNINIDHEQGAAFISRYRNYRWVGRSQRTRYSEFGDPIVQEGMSVQFEEGTAIVTDSEIIAAMINDPKTFGVDFCIDPADRTGYWEKFRKEFPEDILKKHFPMGIPAALSAELSASVANEIASVAGSSKLERGVILVAKGKVPIKDGGRERFTESQEAALEKIGA